MHHLLFWHWWILAGILLVGEILSFTSFLLWIAVAAFVTGIVKFFVPTVNWQWQMVLFAILAVIGVLIALMILKNRKYLNKKGLYAVQCCVDCRAHLGCDSVRVTTWSPYTHIHACAHTHTCTHRHAHMHICTQQQQPANKQTIVVHAPLQNE